MATPRARKLKVFQAQLGFFDSVVAAPSQTAALEAWETHQDLFASGDARISTDEAAIKAALAHPGTPLQRPVGTKEAFSLHATGSPKGPPASKRGAGADAKRKPKAKADRSKLDAAEAALERLDREREGEEAELHREQEALDARRAAARDSYVEARKSAAAAVAAARTAYSKAGGK